MTPPDPFFHALLRPAVLQILRAAGYHAARAAVVDALTDLAARYLALLCEATARHAAGNGTSLRPTVVDARLALEDAGALMPQRVFAEQEFSGDEDTRGADDFVAWFAGPRHRELRRVAAVGEAGAAGAEEEATDYLMALKKKHSKAAEDSKFTGTILGRGNDHGAVVVEGAGDINSIHTWMANRRGPSAPPRRRGGGGSDGEEEGAGRASPRPPSSGLSSIGSMPEDMEMDFS